MDRKGRFEKVDGVTWFRMKRPVITRRKQGEITFPTGCGYNGGIIVNGVWVQGILMDSPKVPKGYKLVSMGVGLQLNCCPPYATMFLKKVA